MSSSIPDEWEELPPDPDPNRDLKYDMIDLEVVSASCGSQDYLLFIPHDEDLLRDDEFIVAAESTVCDLIEHV